MPSIFSKELGCNEAHFSYSDFWRMTAFRRGVADVSEPLFLLGVPNGGWRRVRTASQSNGTDEDMDGVAAGEW